MRGALLGRRTRGAGPLAAFLIVLGAAGCDGGLENPDAPPRATGTSSAERLFPIALDGKWGLMRADGRVVVEPRFDWVDEYSEGFARFAVGGEPVIWLGDPRHDGGKWGFVDARGQVVIPARFDGAQSFHGGLAATQTDDKQGFIDRTGAFAIRPAYDEVHSFGGSVTPVRRRAKWGIIDRNAKWVLEPKHAYIGGFAEGYALFKPAKPAAKPGEGTWGYLSESGEEAIAAKYEFGSSFSEGRAGVRIDGKWGFIDKTGNLVIPYEFDEVGSFQGGLAPAWRKDKVGLVNKRGEWVLRPKYSLIGGYSDGLWAVNLGGECVVYFGEPRGARGAGTGGKWGFISSNGVVVVPLKYDMARPFRRGLALVGLCEKQREDGRVTGFTWRYGYINKAGEYVWRPRR